MREFAEAFLLVFGQLAVGGLFSLSIPPFQQLERGFFKSTGAIYLGAAGIALTGWAYLLLTRNVPETLVRYRLFELGLWLAFAAASGLYLYSLWGDPYRLRARSYAAALLLGVLALTSTSWRYPSPSLVGAVVYPIVFLASALLLGSAATGMLIGHWYLIDLGLTLTPFRRVYRLFITAIHIEVATLAVSSALLWIFARPAIEGAATALWADHRLLVVLRFGLGPLAAYALGWMIGRTLEVPQTMAATGLFYLALLAVVVGEILGRTMLFRTALPL
jgi:hypothetical protein